MPADAVDWDSIVRRHQHRVVVSLLALGLPLDQAEDVASEAWTRLMVQHRAGAFTELSFPGLAIRQAHFLALNAHKRRALDQQRRASESEGREVESTLASPESAMVNRERLERCRAALGDCSPKALRILRLAYSDPPSPHAEIAEEVGLSLQRVRQTLCETRQKLRDALGGHP